MDEWWTYRLSDFLMFAPATYWRLIELYQHAVWPGQLLALLAGLGCLAAAGQARPRARGAGLGVLALVWLWVGWAFHGQRYATINWAAAYLAWAFALQALLLALVAARVGATPGGPPAPALGVWQRAGWMVAAAAVLVYPLSGWLAGRPLAQWELFGLTPDPTAVATLGLLPSLARDLAGRWWVLAGVLPLLSLAIGAATLWTMAN